VSARRARWRRAFNAYTRSRGLRERMVRTVSGLWIPQSVARVCPWVMRREPLAWRAVAPETGPDAFTTHFVQW
jgi:hypothetical protein